MRSSTCARGSPKTPHTRTRAAVTSSTWCPTSCCAAPTSLPASPPGAPKRSKRCAKSRSPELVNGTTGYARSRGAHLGYVVRGDGPIDVLYGASYKISCEATDDEPHVAHMLRRLEAFSRVIRFDMRGIGASDPIDHGEPMNTEAQAADVVAVLDAVGSERVALVAESGFGGAAVMVAATHPERVQALVLVNSSARFIADDEYSIGLSPEFAASFVNDLTDPDEEWRVGE